MKLSGGAIVLLAWFTAAVAVVATGLFAAIPLPPPVIVGGLAAATIALVLGRAAGRAWVASVDLRLVLVLHLVRFVGIAFLVLINRGTLDPLFIPIAWGDLIAALGAVALLAARPELSTLQGWWSVCLWNVFGLADMLLLIATGVRLATTAPEQFTLFRELPFGLLPTFFVPLIIATHVFVFVRLASAVQSSPARRELERP